MSEGKIISKEDLITSNNNLRTAKTFLVRIACWISLIITYHILMAPIYYILEEFPVIGILFLVVGILIGIFWALMASTITTLVVMASVWLKFKPHVSLSMIFVAVILLLFLILY
jgi:hypothetical protein